MEYPLPDKKSGLLLGTDIGNGMTVSKTSGLSCPGDHPTIPGHFIVLVFEAVSLSVAQADL